jgi:hypothetical protein
MHGIVNLCPSSRTIFVLPRITKLKCGLGESVYFHKLSYTFGHTKQINQQHLLSSEPGTNASVEPNPHFADLFSVVLDLCGNILWFQRLIDRACTSTSSIVKNLSGILISPTRLCKLSMNLENQNFWQIYVVCGACI